jgi:RHS repeat-associated protein
MPFNISIRIAILTLYFLFVAAAHTVHSQPTDPEWIGNKQHAKDVSGLNYTGDYDIVSGNLKRTSIDISIGGREGAPPLVWERYYNSFSRGTDNWRFSYHYKANELQTGQGEDREYLGFFVYFQGGSSSEPYRTNSDAQTGGWVLNSFDTNARRFSVGSKDRIYRIGARYSNSYDLKLPDGSVVHMEAINGSSQKNRVKTIKSPYGSEITVSYSPTSGLMNRVSDTFGRWINISYYVPPSYPSSEQKIRKVQASDGQWAEYTWASGGITQVKYSDGSTATFKYKEFITKLPRVFKMSECDDPRALSSVKAAKFIFPSASSANGVTYNDGEITKITTLTDDLISERIKFPISSSLKQEFHECRGDGAVAKFEAQMTYPNDSESLTIYKKVDFSGNVYNYTYGINNWLTRVDFPDGSYEEYTNEPILGNCVSIRKRDSSIIHITYSSQIDPYHVNKVVQAGTRTHEVIRNSLNQITDIIYPDGSIEKIAYNTRGQIIKRVARNGATVINDYNNIGQLIRKSTPFFGVTPINYISYTYYPDSHAWGGKISTVTNPLGHKTFYEYDLSFVNGSQGTIPCPGRGLVTKITNPDNTTVKFKYSTKGELIAQENELQQSTSTVFDQFSRIKIKFDQNGNYTTFNYQPTIGPLAESFTASEFLHIYSIPKSIVSNAGRKMQYTYNASNNLVQETAIDGITALSTKKNIYDSLGNVIKTSANIDTGSWFDISYAYDILGRRRFEFMPLGRTTEWQYDVFGNNIKLIHPDGTFRTKTFDTENRVLSETDERGFTTTFTYHTSGMVNAITDARGNTHTHTYDASDRLLTRTYPDGSTESWTYDAVGNKLAHKNRSGQIIRYTYDSRNRETYRAWDGHVAPAVVTTYDAAGHVLSRTNSNSTNSYTYDLVGRVISETQSPVGAASVTFTYSYDADGNRTSLTSTLGQSLDYIYNARGELTQINRAAQVVVSYGYNLAGERVTRTLGNHTLTSYGYDAARRLISLSTRLLPNGPNILAQRYGHDLRDRRKWSLRDEANGDAYDYLPDGQLSRYRHEVSRPDLDFFSPAAWTDTFTYDGVGNRTSLDENGVVTTYTANSLNQYTNVTGANLSYSDGRGNLTQWQDWNYAYDADNRLISASKPGRLISFNYDAQGRLVKIIRDGLIETRYYDGAQVFIRTTGGSIIDQNIWGPIPDELLARQHVASNAWHYFHQDQIQNVFAVTDATGAVVERYLYDPFGEPDIRTASWLPLIATAINNPTLFTGQEWIEELRLSNYKNRFYQPELGRFLQNDPIRFDGGDMNLYRYAGGNPIMNVDPTGLYDVWTGTMGGLKALGGGLEVVAGGALFAAGTGSSWTGVGVAGGLAVGHGADTFQSGVRQLISGERTDSLTSKGLQAAGMSPQAANLTDAGIGAAFSLGASAGSSALRTSSGLVHMTTPSNAASIAQNSQLVGNNFAGPVSNAFTSSVGLALRTGLGAGSNAAIGISSKSAGAFSPVLGIGPITTWQASMGHVFTANGSLNVATGAFARAGINTTQATWYSVDAAFTSFRFYDAAYGNGGSQR